MDKDVRLAAGTLYRIRSGEYEAVVASVGGALNTLTYRGVPLIDSFDVSAPRSAYHGSPLAPWPNRLDSGCYTFEECSYQLPIDEPQYATALHGLVCWDDWHLVARGEGFVELETVIAPRPGYPHTVRVGSRYELDEGGLRWNVYAQNLGDSEAPMGLGTHAYLRPGTGTVDDWFIEAPVNSVLEPNERMLPHRWRRVVDRPDLDVRSSGLTGMVIDHCYSGLPDQVTVTVLNRSTSIGVALSWERDQAPWLQICTSDFEGTKHFRTGIAVEPMSCPPDAFNSAEGLVVLGPAKSLETSSRISAVGFK